MREKRKQAGPGVTPREGNAVVAQMSRQRRTGRGAAPGHRERVAERQAQAMKLRVAGATFRQIGAQLGVSGKTAHEDVMTALAETVAERNASAEQLRAVECERMDRLTTFLWPRAQNGDCEAARTLVRVSERRSKLLGLDAETSARLTVAGHVTSTSNLVVANTSLTDLPTDELQRRLSQFRDLLAPLPSMASLMTEADVYRAAMTGNPLPRPEAPPAPPTDEDRYAAKLAARNGAR